MYTIGDIVAYSSQGICKVTEVCTKNIGGKQMEYYILRPVYDPRCTVSVPVGNEKLLSRIRPVASPSEVSSLMSGISRAENLWIDDDNKRREYFTSVLTEGKLDMLFSLFKTLVLRRRELETLSRKLRTADEGFLRQAEKLICCECSYVGYGEQEEIRDALIRELL